MSKIARRAVRASLAFGLLGGITVAGVTSASAASPIYGCTASYPEICLGVYYTVDSYGDRSFTHEQIQADVDADLYYRYTLITPDGVQHTSATYYSTAATWGAKWTPGYTAPGEYQAVVQTGTTPQLTGKSSQWIQVSAY